MSTPQEQEDAKVVSDMQKLARLVDTQLPYGLGFVVLAFPFGADGRMNYISNAQRPDIVRAMYEFIEATKDKWGEHVPESAAAEDEEIGRARQRIAELEGLAKSAADALSPEQNPVEPPDYAHLIAELRKAAQVSEVTPIVDDAEA